MKTGIMRGAEATLEIRKGCFGAFRRQRRASGVIGKGQKRPEGKKGPSASGPGVTGCGSQAGGGAGESGARMLGGSLDTPHRSWRATSRVVME